MSGINSATKYAFAQCLVFHWVQNNIRSGPCKKHNTNFKITNNQKNIVTHTWIINKKYDNSEE
jgi:hypothetical protein